MRSRLNLIVAFSFTTITSGTLISCSFPNNSIANDKTIETSRIARLSNLINGNSNAIDIDTDWLLKLTSDTNSDFDKNLFTNLNRYYAYSVFKTSPVFNDEYKFAITEIENRIENEISALKIKKGRKWETDWQSFLDKKQQGGNDQPNSGSKILYKIKLIEEKAVTALKNVALSYANDYKYHTITEIRYYYDLLKKWVLDNKDINTITDFTSYNGEGKNKIFIVAKSILATESLENENDAKKKLFNKIKKNEKVVFKEVLKAENPENTFFKTNPGKTIPYLLNNLQQRLFKAAAKAKPHIYMRQIVIPFNSSAQSNALKKEITGKQFEDQKANIIKVLVNIKENGFSHALKEISTDNIIKTNTTPDKSGDLGLVDISNTNSKEMASIIYNAAKLLSNKEFLGLNSANYPEINNINDLSAILSEVKLHSDDLTKTAILNKLVANINFSNSKKQIAFIKYEKTNDLTYDGFDGEKIGVFIDNNGIHFMQFPGISYKNFTEITKADDMKRKITSFLSKLKNPEKAIEEAHLFATNQKKMDEFDFNTAAKIVQRLGSVTDNSYQTYLTILSFYENFKDDPIGNKIGNNSNTPFEIRKIIDNAINDGALKNWTLILTDAHEKIKFNINSADTTTKDIALRLKAWFNIHRQKEIQKITQNNPSKNIKAKLDELNNDQIDKDNTGTVPAINYNFDDYNIWINNIIIGKLYNYSIDQNIKL